MSSGRPVLINDVAAFDGRNPSARLSVLDRGGVIAEIGDLLLVRGDPAVRINAAADIVRIWRGGASVQRCSYDE